MNEPIDHHYLPIFYVSRWRGADGRITRFSQPTGEDVKAKRVVPKGTGFEPRLYEMSGLPPERAQAMEKDFMSKLDSMAAKALGLLEQGLPDNQWTSRPRSSWSRFMLAQMLRAPEDIAQLKASVKQDWGAAIPELEEVYAARRSDSDPPTVREYLALQNPGETDEMALGVARRLMNHAKIGQMFNNMHWLVLDVPTDEYPLLTSDRPIWMTTTLTEEDAFIAMPIGPRKLFTATVNASTQRRLKEQPRGGFARALNKLVVQHAVKYVYGVDDDALAFVQKHMSTRRQSTLIERLARKHGHEIVAPDAPRDK